ITDVYNAKAQYDQSITSVIFFQNQIQQRAETLSQIIGVFTSDLSPFETNIPLIQPNPANINDWVNIALQQNFSLAAARYNMQANLDNISVQRAGHLPVLDATGNYQRIIQGNNGYGDLNQDQFTGGIEITFPVYQGGLIVANTRADEAQYQQAEANMQVIYRKTVSNTRQNYKNIISGIQQLKADKQAIASAYSSMKSNETAFTVGERTIIDVLNSQVTYIDNKRIYSEALYTYLNSIIALKQAAGTLGIGDVLQLNNWLQQQPFTTINQNKKP
ncbi:MAG: TolC family protein, partial [Gammaproteobacteria bacterium]